MRMTTPTNGRRLLTPDETADLLRISPRTLENWRARGHGPPYLRLTRRRIAYRERDVLSWIDSRLRASTAAERPPAEAAS
jgi:predicted DNA-binding transcriptional regulator AlpA